MARVGQSLYIYTVIYGIFGRIKITKYTIIYGVYIRYWPALLIAQNSNQAQHSEYHCTCMNVHTHIHRNNIQNTTHTRQTTHTTHSERSAILARRGSEVQEAKVKEGRKEVIQTVQGNLPAPKGKSEGFIPFYSEWAFICGQPER
jgi:hypothetical protein